MWHPRCDVGATRCFLSTFGAKSAKKCSPKSCFWSWKINEYSEYSVEYRVLGKRSSRGPKYHQIPSTSFFKCSLGFSIFLVWFFALQPSCIPVLLKIKRNRERAIFNIVFMDFRPIGDLRNIRKYGIMRKSMKNVLNIARSRFLLILSNTGIPDGCNAKNQTKKIEKASEH